MWGQAQLVVLLMAALSAHGDAVQEDTAELQVGRAVDVFTRYGYFSISMKVVPRTDAPFLFREPTVDVFRELGRWAQRPDTFPRKPKNVFQGDFHMEFCDNVQQLVQAYFRDFAFESMDKPWKAFTGSWTPDAVAKNLGINASFVHKEHCYVLVRLSRFRDSVTLTKIPNNVNLEDVVAKEIENIQVGDVASVEKFIKKYGSHYIESYVTGNSLYQVFVFRRATYTRIKERLRTRGISHLDKLELEQYFSPWYAEHIGQLKVASGNQTVESWTEEKLRVHYYIFAYPSLLKIHGDPHLLAKLNDLLQNEAILGMGLKTLAPAFKDPIKRTFFMEVVDNFLKLWETNL